MTTWKDHAQALLVAQWRHLANEASTADAAVTYTDCADALDATLSVHVLQAVCEGCGVEVPMPTRKARKVYPDVPDGWSQSGVSKHGLKGRVRLAAWCPACRATRPQR